jgi:predicted Zn-dependent protease with MMP-like domain
MTGYRKKLGPDTFDRLVDRAISRIPLEFRRHLDNVVITVQARPSRELLAELGFSAEEELFGYFSGIPLTERDPANPPLYPDTIYIFQEPLEAYCFSREELLDEIEITVVHEIAHFIGFDDDQLAALGYG